MSEHSHFIRTDLKADSYHLRPTISIVAALIRQYTASLLMQPVQTSVQNPKCNRCDRLIGYWSIISLGRKDSFLLDT